MKGLIFMKKILFPILFFFILLSPFSVFADEEKENESNSWDSLKQDLRYLDLKIGEHFSNSDFPYIITFDDSIQLFEAYDYPSEIVYDGYDYYLCGEDGHDACKVYYSSGNSSTDWFNGSENVQPFTDYDFILPLSGKASFAYNYSSVSGSSSTSVGFGLSFYNTAKWANLFEAGGSVGRPSSGTFHAYLNVDTSVSNWVDGLKKSAGIRCFAGGGANHGTQSCSGSITKYYYRVGEHINEYTVSLSVSPEGAGSVIGSGTYEEGSEVLISAISNEDYVFKQWSDGNTENPRNIIVNSNITLAANFEKLNYPQPPSPDITNNITNNIDQSTTINNNISFGNGSSGSGGKVLFNQIDYYNLYSIYRVNFKQFVDTFGLKCTPSSSGDYTCKFDGVTDDISKGIKFEYVDTGDYLGGQYLFYIYDHSLLQARASNMLVSTESITLDVCSPDNPDFCIKHAFALSNGAVARDVSEFNYEYVDGLNTYGYDRLANALTQQMTMKDKQVLFNYQGSVAKTSKSVLGSTSCMVSIYEKDGQSYSLNFAITDSVNTMNSINVQLNQKLEQTKQDLTNTELNQANQSLDKMNELIEIGNSQSQQSSSNLNSINNSFKSSVDSLENVETEYLENLNDNLGNLNISFDLGSNTDFINSANFVRTHFDRLTSNPFGTLIGFSLSIGLSLLILGKRL